jgi:cytochrome c
VRIHLIVAALALLAAPLAFAIANPTEGRAVFEDMCADCHTVTPGKHKRGPSLAGVLGRPAGAAANYNYSEAMRQSGITWSPERLARYLAAPKTDLPGTKMRLLSHPQPQEISDLIAWLQQNR